MDLPVSSLQPGHLIDLEKITEWLNLCPFNVDCGECDSAYVAMESEYAVVEGGELETDECYRLDTTQGSFGLPSDLLVTVEGHQTDTYEMRLL